MKKVLCISAVISTILLLQLSAISQPFTLLKDINANTSSLGGNSNPLYLTNFNGTLFFTASDMNSPFFPIGNEVFKSDGTTAGTVLLRDIGQAAPGNPQNLTVFNGSLYFVINDNQHGYELWKTGGTAASCEMVKDINVGGPGANISGLIVVNNTLYFSATDGSGNNGQELWKTDGTEAGTVMVRDIIPGTGSGDPINLINVNGVLYFTAVYGVNGIKQLYKSDGTEAGTVMVGPEPYRAGHPYNLTLVNDLLFYSFGSTGPGNELWVTNVTDASGYKHGVKDIMPGSQSSGITSMIAFNNQAYFVADDGTNGRELWKSDGTGAGTAIAKNIDTHLVPGGQPGSPFNIGSDPLSLMVFNGSLYFSASSIDNGGRELWKTDGTEAGTVMVKDINPAGSSFPVIIGRSGFKFYFAANDGIHGNELWSSDGTTEGTVMVQDIEPGPGSSDPANFIEVGGKMYVSVTTSGTARELWVANAPANGPLPLQLLEFKGLLADNDGLLQWKTDNELNTKSFAVERSTDGRNYSKIGQITAANASGIHTYDYTDANIKSLGASIVYYRLSQVDIDNKFTYSRIVALSIDKRNSFAMLYPNPVRSEINLTITLAKKERLNWQLIDNNGRTIKSGFYNLSAGSTAVSVNVSNIGAGNYIMQLKGESLQQSIKVIKQ